MNSNIGANEYSGYEIFNTGSLVKSYSGKAGKGKMTSFDPANGRVTLMLRYRYIKHYRNGIPHRE